MCRKSSCKRLNHKEQCKTVGTEMRISLLCGVGMLILKSCTCNFCSPVRVLCFSTMPRRCMISVVKTSWILNLGTRSWAMLSFLCVRNLEDLRTSSDMVAKKTCFTGNRISVDDSVSSYNGSVRRAFIRKNILTEAPLWTETPSRGSWEDSGVRLFKRGWYYCTGRIFKLRYYHGNGLRALANTKSDCAVSL